MQPPPAQEAPLGDNGAVGIRVDNGPPAPGMQDSVPSATTTGSSSSPTSSPPSSPPGPNLCGAPPIDSMLTCAPGESLVASFAIPAAPSPPHVEAGTPMGTGSVAAFATPPGVHYDARVIVHDLRNEDLNGLVGFVESFNATAGRWTVRSAPLPDECCRKAFIPRTSPPWTST